MPFIRVRGATPGDPAHEFDAPVSVVEADPHLYEVLDKVPVSEPRPPKHVVPVRSEQKPVPAEKLPKK